MGEFIVALVLIALSSYLIKYAADQFEPAADFLGRNMPPGIKGATINAVGSSLPELMTGLAFVFTVSKLTVAEGILSAVAVTAGSAVFNILIIPAMVVLAATLKNASTHIKVDKSTVWRDGIFLLIAEVALIIVLGLPIISWGSALLLVAIYACYFGYLMWQNMTHITIPPCCHEDEPEPKPEPEDLKSSFWEQVFKLDFHNLVFKGQKWTTKMAWSVLGLSVFVMGLACHLLAESVVGAADAIGVHAYIAAVIFAAAATSVPDTVLSIKDALKEQYEDAVSNAVGSNIFDITICTGIPLLLYTVIFGSIGLELTGALDQQVQLLRIVLLGVSVAVIGMFLVGKEIGRGKAIAMLAMYVAWISWIVITAIGGTV